MKITQTSGGSGMWTRAVMGGGRRLDEPCFLRGLVLAWEN